MSKGKNPYIIQSVKELQNDLSQLPQNLQQKWQNYQKILALDPYQTLGFPSHNLTGKLKGCRALEIDWNGNPYRLVYRIHEKPSPKRVVILMSDEDPRYILRARYSPKLAGDEIRPINNAKHPYLLTVCAMSPSIKG